MDIARLIKLMMMTTSSSDAEALVATRKANQLLAASNRNWEEILRDCHPGLRPSSPPPGSTSPSAWEATTTFKETRWSTHGGYRKSASVPPGVTPEHVDKLFVLALRRTKGTKFGHVVRGLKSWWDRERSLTLEQLIVIKKAITGEYDV